MGLCFGKKKKQEVSPPCSTITPDEKKVEKPSLRVVEATTERQQVLVVAQHSTAVDNEKKRGETSEKKACKEATTERQQVLVVAQHSTAVDNKKKRGETSEKKACKEVETNGLVVPPVEEYRPAAVFTTPSCTEEEVDAILIQCGRLSRSSSGKASAETGPDHRKRSGSKRSYDFDSEKKGEEDDGEWEEKPVSRPSPRRRTPSRDRSGSRERGSDGGGGRRANRSPGRRSEGPASSGTPSGRSKQPAKMVAVPAREKGRGISPVASNKRCGDTGALRSASPRSRSPASATTPMSNENAACHLNQPPSLTTRSSARKGEQSPFRRNPMAEIDENTLRANQSANTTNKAQKIKEEEEGTRKLSQAQTQKASESSGQTIESFQRNGAAADLTSATKGNSSVQMRSCRKKEQQMEPAAVEEAIDKASSKVAGASSLGVGSHEPKTTSSRGRSSWRSSRDLDHPLGNQETFLSPNAHTSLLLEDLHNYHQQHPNTTISCPACVSKACSIHEAAADLNSTSSENKSYSTGRQTNNDKASFNGRHRRRGSATKESFVVESEMVVKDDILEPSLHKYVTVRGDEEPQESAGSNSFLGQPWSSGWGPNSVDSTDRCRTSRSNDGEEVEQEARRSPISHQSRYLQQHSYHEVLRDPKARGSSENKKELSQRTQIRRPGGGGGGKAGGSRGRAYTLPAAAAAAAASS